MATHSVPQDVEADDKLVGFLSLKQFIFTIIGLGFGYLSFFFFTKVHPLSALIWLPFSLVFFVLGLYQRKDQPVEVYLASALGFYLRPHVRIWSQDGYEERVHITAPPVLEKHYTKNFTGEEAVSRLEGLSLMMDSRGWASKKVTEWQNPQLATIASDSDRLLSNQDVSLVQSFDSRQYSQPADPYDTTSRVGQQFEARIEAADDATHQQAIQVMQGAHNSTTRVLTPPVQAVSTTSMPTDNPAPPASPPTTTQTPPPDESATTHDNTSPVAPIASPPASAPVQVPDDTVASDEAVVVNTSVEEPKKTPSTPAKEQKLNVPRQTEDGSVELRLH